MISIPLFTYFKTLFLTVLCLHYCTWAAPSCSEWELLFVWFTGFVSWCLSLPSMASRPVSVSSCVDWVHWLRLMISGVLAQYCGAWAQLLHSLWDFLEPGIKPMSYAFTGRFLTLDTKEVLIPVLLNMFRFVLWSRMWSILVNVPCELEKNVYFAIVS